MDGRKNMDEWSMNGWTNEKRINKKTNKTISENIKFIGQWADEWNECLNAEWMKDGWMVSESMNER